LATAVPIENKPKATIAGSIDHLLPHNSDIGAQHRGPKANPRLFVDTISIRMNNETYGVTYIYSEIARTVTSLLTPTYAAIAFSPGAMILDPKLAAKASMPSWKVIQLLYPVPQFLGFAGSKSPSQSTRFGSFFSFSQ
jgi:hypothetical protein